MAIIDYVPPSTQMMDEIAQLRAENHRLRMSLRDQMAMAIIPALMARFHEHGYDHNLGAVAYSIADDVLDAREVMAVRRKYEK